MAGIKGKSGGARQGAGRSSAYKKDGNKRVIISDEVYDLLSRYSEGLGLSRSDIVNALCLLYLDKHNKDIMHCQKCGKPILFEFVQTCDSAECACGEIYEVPNGSFDFPAATKSIRVEDLDDFDLKSLKPGEAIKIK